MNAAGPVADLSGCAAKMRRALFHFQDVDDRALRAVHLGAELHQLRHVPLEGAHGDFRHGVALLRVDEGLLRGLHLGLNRRQIHRHIPIPDSPHTYEPIAISQQLSVTL